MRVGYPNPIWGLEEGARELWEPLAACIRARTNLDPDAFALAVYNAVWVTAVAYVTTGPAPGIDALKQPFGEAAARYFGATGWTVLNEAGDRLYGDFDFRAIRMESGGPRWGRVARFESRTGRLDHW